MTDFVKLTIYVLDVADYKKNLEPIGEVYRDYFGKYFPAMTLVGVRDLFDAANGALIEIERMAALPPLPREVLPPSSAPSSAASRSATACRRRAGPRATRRRARGCR